MRLTLELKRSVVETAVELDRHSAEENCCPSMPIALATIRMFTPTQSMISIVIGERAHQLAGGPILRKSAYFVTCPRTSPCGFAAVWMLK